VFINALWTYEEHELCKHQLSLNFVLCTHMKWSFSNNNTPKWTECWFIPTWI